MAESIHHTVQALIRSAGSQKLAAQALDISPQYLCDILAGRRDISAELAGRLGYQRIVAYRLKPEAEADV